MLFTRLVKIHQPIFLRSAQSIIEKLNYKRWILCSWQRGQTNPFRRLRRQLFPFLSPVGRGWILGRTLSVAYGDSSPEGESPWQRGQVSSSSVNGRKKSAVKLQTFRLCQSLSLSGEVARRSRDGEGRFRYEPSQSPTATALPKGEPLAKRAGFVLVGQGQKKPAYKR